MKSPVSLKKQQISQRGDMVFGRELQEVKKIYKKILKIY